MKSIGLLLLIIVFFSVDAKSMSEAKIAQNKALKRLKSRKRSYDQYHKKTLERKKTRVADAYRHKKIRAKYNKKKDAARAKYKRVETGMPLSAYKKFRKLRDRQAQKIEKSRNSYIYLQKSLKELHKRNRYKIDKMREYKL